MIEVIQIIIGDLPEYLTEYYESVRKYAHKNDFEHIIIKEVPEQYRGMREDLASNFMRMDLLSEKKYRLYVDWDVMLYDNFSVGGDLPIYSKHIEQIMYNGNNPDQFADIRKMVSPETQVRYGRQWIYKMVNRNLSVINRFDENSYKHLTASDIWAK